MSRHLNKPNFKCIRKAAASNTLEIQELSDSDNKLRKATDDKEKEGRSREERRLNWERRQDEKQA